jgi:hypothetical protein
MLKLTIPLMQPSAIAPRARIPLSFTYKKIAIICAQGIVIFYEPPICLKKEHL